MDGHLSFPRFFAIMNSAPKNILIHIFWYNYIYISLDKCLGVDCWVMDYIHIQL